MTSGEVEAPARVERLCRQFLAERADPATVEWAQTQFVRDKALGFARDSEAVSWLVEVAALLDGVDAATGSCSTGAPDPYTDRGARVRRSVLHQAVTDPDDRERVEQILRDSRVHPLDPGVCLEAQALHDGRTVCAILPTTAVVLTAERMRAERLSLADVARSQADVIAALSAGELFYNAAARERYRGWAELAGELWRGVGAALEDGDVRSLLDRLPVGGDPDAARRTMVENLVASGDVTDAGVRAAFAAVPRHRFAPPDTPLATAYGDRAVVVTKRDPTGRALSSVSAPWLQATMIERGGVRSGSRVLEIGSGGYNAALLAEIVGPTGQVISVDIDPEVVDRARARLDATGYRDRVQVVLSDGAHRVCPPGERVDVVLVTVGAWDIAPAWIEQLTDGGVLVVPLRMNGMTRVIPFRRDGEHLHATSAVVCGFVPMQGEDAHDDQEIHLPAPGDDGAQVTLRLGDRADGEPDGDSDGAVDPVRLRQVLDGEPTIEWTGVTAAGMESLADLFLRFATLLPGYCGVSADDGVELAASPARSWPHGVVHGDGLAYLVSRPDGDRTELGACARGGSDNAASAAAALCDQIHEWGRTRTTEPTFTYWPTGTTAPDTPTTARVGKRHGTLLVAWPAPVDDGSQP